MINSKYIIISILQIDQLHLMQEWANYLDRLRAGEEPEATASQLSEVLAFSAHDGRIYEGRSPGSV